MGNKNLIPASSFVSTIAANVDNTKLNDVEFREFIRNTLPIVEYDKGDNLNVNK